MDSLIIFCAKYLIFAIPLMVIWLWTRQPIKGRPQLVLAVVITALAALLLTKLTEGLYSNPRPFVVEHSMPLVAHGNDNGFPSEHTVYAMSLTAVIFYYHRRLAASALVITLLVGIGRVAADVHHGIDIMAGLVVGAVAGSIGYWLAKRLMPGGQQATVDQQDD